VGSKNRIYLGVVTAAILHHHRNSLHKPIYMSKRVEAKIKEKHTDSSVYTSKLTFSELLDNTIASSLYASGDGVINFIAHMESSNSFVLYSLKREKHHTSCSTIFKLRPSTLKKYYNSDSFRFMKNEYSNIVEKYIN